MKLFFQKDVIIDRIKKLIQLLIRIKDFVLEPPPGYLEYQKAIASKDEHFNYMENEYFKRHILPYIIKGHDVKHSDHYSIDQQQLFNNHPQDTFRINPVTGLPMIGSYDAGGSPFGFNYNHSIHHQINHHSSFSNMHTGNQFNSFDYWNR
ncbi:hypothetical protein A6J40_12700 [Legionella longbeachae]|uniref:hypothetical protein n=1 Tax=Legionella longbeachae TaxID=450 RepID=UPI0009B79319|nr:hypothetical protein [Legionella longbeachae]ARB92984.1 hypothetical protein A6J40_12700 [Legionella longbeachae]RZV26637.1 hypothetical protein EKG34_05725 [Legionella longbeachae]UAK47122.1 hypothetical protein K8O86_02725 [Legionella longbeachae]VEE04184.1 Uncharacterised protein [Legionella oakridgensis]